MANQHFELARLDDTVGIRIDDSALRNRNIERNGLGLTRLKLHALERFELAVRPTVGRHDIADIQLRYFGAFALAGVGERNLDCMVSVVANVPEAGTFVIVGSPYAKVV